MPSYIGLLFFYLINIQILKSMLHLNHFRVPFMPTPFWTNRFLRWIQSLLIDLINFSLINILRFSKCFTSTEQNYILSISIYYILRHMLMSTQMDNSFSRYILVGVSIINGVINSLKHVFFA